MTNELLREYLQAGKTQLVKCVEIVSDVTKNRVRFSLWHVVDRHDDAGNLAHENHVLTIMKQLHNENVGPGSAVNDMFEVHLHDGVSGWMTACNANKRLIALVTNHMLL